MSDAAPLTEVAEGIYQLRLPLPFALNAVNIYLLRSSGGWTVVDTGLNTDAARLVWENAFISLGITPSDIEQIILTHVHPDHFGLAGWLQEQAAAVGAMPPPVRLSSRERDLARLLWMGEGKQSQSFDEFLLACGMPGNMVETVVVSLNATSDATFPHPSIMETINAGDTLRIGSREFQLIHAPGHSDGQLILYDAADRLILSGDHVLMKITPNIGFWPDTEADPLGRYLESLQSLQALDVRLALPGHKALITDWRGRLAELLHHHEERLEHTMAAIVGGANVYEASLKVFESARFSAHEWRFAMVETLAHLEYLRQRERVRQVDEDGLWKFYPA